MAYCPAPDVRFCHTFHLESCHHTCLYANGLQCTLKCQAVDNGSQHAHVVAGDTLDARGLRLDSPEYIASANNNGYLGTELLQFLYFFGIMPEHIGRNAKTLAAHKAFPGELEQYTTVLEC